jgi:hypothetical protein
VNPDSTDVYFMEYSDFTSSVPRIATESEERMAVFQRVDMISRLS